MPTTTLRRLGALPCVLLLILAGCSSDSGPSERHEGFAGGRSKPPTPMAGHESFFDNQILAEITVGAEALPPGAADQGSGDQNNSNPGGGGHRHGGGGGGMNVRGGTGGGVGGNLSGNIPFGGGGDRPSRGSGDDGGGYHGPRAMGGRPVEIHLRFTNKGAAPVTLVIDDFTSPLGNFAVRPESLTLEAGQSAETEPMSSQLAGLYSEADATLVLRIGEKTEKKTFTLHAVVPPPAAADKPEASTK